MIKVYTKGEPDEQIKQYAGAIFALEKKKRAYNLPLPGHPQQDLFEKLFKLGVVQIIHDGKSDKIHCLNGYTQSINVMLGRKTNFGREIIIENEFPEKLP
ncbi:hypothetical protein COT42_07220 [Candidatus Saganbacteria bacterium CG08_land_8_20_14_0_20_45_16]|uniref:Uncharacterized protein n=1 Tax=Candidatus Saganbacteria bacterium CG08_land_8_20_14_0_20_45_16 TaxID=2014293 RepID=A0A2H0XVC2_UNCSA|nr:MAG: hypothetical protein COT42_07220 [Candidatus Saganbacteria bacterium CG08_land_8_20_14_0_20_45_16]